MERTNLDIVTGGHVEKILFDRRGTRAKGVVFDKDGEKHIEEG